jgi:hypothetical protein
MRKRSIFITICFILTGVFNNGFAGIGSSGAQFLQIGGGVRALSIGSAFVAVADGLDAIYWNPAGVAGLNTNRNFALSHINYFADMSFDNAAFTMPTFGGVIGLSGMALLSGDIEITTVEEPDGTGETYSANDYAFGLTYATNLTQKFSVGVTGKLINQSIDELSATSWGLDIGAVYQIGVFNNMKAGFAIVNFGPDLRYNGDDLLFRTAVFEDETSQAEDVRAEYLTEKYQMPLRLQMGFSMDVFRSEQHSMVAAVDAINPNDQNESFVFGVEYALMDRYFLRAGYSDINDKGLTAGMGLNVGNMNAGGLSIDYGFEAHQYLGDLHRFGVGLVF